MKNKNTALVLPHTHWDREWRYPIWQNRWLLVRFMDELLEILETDKEYGCFLMDAQVVPLMDYLEIRPENRERIRKQTAAGRLIVGPWYTLPDLYPLDGECLIRNLLKGLRLSSEFGCSTKVAYHAFGWGQTAQFPQLYSQLGFDLIIAAKKVSEERAPRSEFLWQSPDGSEMLTTRLGQHFRANGFFTAHIPILYGVSYLTDEYRFDWAKAGRLVHWADAGMGVQDYFRQDREQGYHAEQVEPTMRETWDNMGDSTCPNVRLLMYGSDFTTPNHRLTRILRDANAAIDDIEFKMAGPDEYAGLLHANLDKGSLRRVMGELRDGPSAGCTGNALATRMPLKLLNKKVENRLIRQAEPFAAMLYLLGEAYPSGFLRRAWEYLLKAHPHDSINGVTQDKSANDTLYRLTQAQEIGEVLCLQCADALATRLDLSAFAANEQLVLLVNPQPRPFRGVVKLVVDTPQDECVDQIGFEDAAGMRLDVQRISREERKTPVNDFDSRPWAFNSDRHTVLMDTGEIPSGGCKVVKVTSASHFKRDADWWPRQADSSGKEISREPRTLENEFLKAVAEPNGTLTLVDKINGRKMSGLLEFEDTGDTGDYWVHYKPAENRQIYSAGQPAEIWLEGNGDLSATLAIRLELRMPVTAEFPGSELQGCGRRSDAETTVSIISRVTLTRGAKSLRVKTTVENRAENHRLRVLIPTGIQTDVLDSSGHFNVDRRAARPEHSADGHSWPEMQTVPMQRFADVSDGTNGLAVLSNSFTEVQLMTDTHRTLALTLFRSVRNRICTEERCTGNFPEQKGGQVLQTMEFEYAIYPHAGGWLEGGVYAEADRLNAEPMCFQISASSGGELPSATSLFELSSDELVLSGIKKAEDRDSAVVRLFNPSAGTVAGALKIGPAFGSAYEVNINEERIAELKVEQGEIKLSVSGGRILTIELTRKQMN
ncbi:MAG: alpha-mannosidase [Kiritimatiellaceae bacterium]|nr:alpha-mannosidase [Kiritimatiellaceae bacterium]